MIGAIVIKKEFVEEATNKYGKKIVDAVFEKMKGQHPDILLNELDGEERECFLTITKNQYQKINKMSLTGSEIVEEILYECYKLGIQKEVMDLAMEYIKDGNSLVESYEMAFKKINKTKEKEKANVIG